ncbi:hypothetical protein [Schlesneria sp. T3-172]|uniref:hypothetical protein n=1 Tax=Schlesneria sphaerica TaxID=3373610 RepID=UPI0037C6EB51
MPKKWNVMGRDEFDQIVKTVHETHSVLTAITSRLVQYNLEEFLAPWSAKSVDHLAAVASFATTLLADIDNQGLAKKFNTESRTEREKKRAAKTTQARRERSSNARKKGG